MAEGAQKAKPRLVADPTIGVADLASALEDFLDKVEKQRKIDLYDFVMPPAGVQWKTAVHVVHLCKMAPMLEFYLAVAPNGVLPSKKHKTALCRLDEARQLNKLKTRARDDFADFVDDKVRMTLAHLRSLRLLGNGSFERVIGIFWSSSWRT